MRLATRTCRDGAFARGTKHQSWFLLGVEARQHIGEPVVQVVVKLEGILVIVAVRKPEHMKLQLHRAEGIIKPVSKGFGEPLGAGPGGGNM